MKPGDHITVKVEGVEYDTVIDTIGTQRFVENATIAYLVNSGRIDLNQLVLDFVSGKFDKRSYAEFNMMTGYSVGGFAELSQFHEWTIENPLWETKDKANT